MSLSGDEQALVAGGIGAVGTFVARWGWDRFWKKKDDSASKAGTLENRMIAIEVRETERARVLGTLETNVNRLDGKVDGLQSFWRTEFAKLTDKFQAFEDKVEYRLDNLRLELRGDQQKAEDRVTDLLTQWATREAAERTAHQQRMHDRINAMSEQQAEMLNDLMDRFVEKIAEPQLSPPKVT